jgi:hypothetical protein
LQRTIIPVALLVLYSGSLVCASENESIVQATYEEGSAEHETDKAGGNVNTLNNLVIELLDVPTPRQEEATDYRFTNPRDGWVFISVESAARGQDKLVLSIDPVPQGEVATLHGIEKGGTLEFMRQLPAGTYQLTVRSEGVSRPSSIVVRAIPELIYTGLGYDCNTRADKSTPWLESYGPYDWKFIENIDLIENVNVILERGKPRPENARHLQDWRKQGKKVLTASFISWLTTKYQPLTADDVYTEWTTSKWPNYGFEPDGYYGTLMSEFGDHVPNAQEFPAFTEAVKRLGQESKFRNRVFYPFTYSSMVQTERTRTFLKTVLEAGYRWAEECYLQELPAEKDALSYIDGALKQHLINYQKTFPGCQRQLIMNLGFISLPHLNLDINPQVDYKVFLDMQMNLIANDPVFLGTYGISWYHSAYADEEMVRWSAKLNRHYCIEGKKDRLSADPYILPHIKNPDFDEGLTGWEFEPAEEGTIAAGEAPEYGKLQGRYKSTGEGNHFLITRRSAKAPNRVSQQIRNLTPGRLYSIRMLVSDYTDLSQRKGVRKTNNISVVIDGVAVLAEKTFREVVNSDPAGDTLYMTYQRMVFRAKTGTAKLVISDWGAGPIGPIGQELAINFIQVQPYLEIE